jgi:hypothetical protein
MNTGHLQFCNSLLQNCLDHLRIPKKCRSLWHKCPQRSLDKFAATCCKNSLGPQHHADGKGQRTVCTPLVHAADHRARLERFLLELGQGFAFVGRQYHLEVSDKDFYIDLLFYHLGLRCFVVIELKKGDFKPEYAGKMNFYCSVVDDKLKHETDQPTIGLILCQTKDRILAEYALRDIHKPIGVSDYELTRALPERLKSALPTIEEIEAELQSEVGEGNDES